jgi:hypothetical protein
VTLLDLKVNVDVGPKKAIRQASKLGKDLNRVPTSSIRIGENDGEYMFAKKYKDHGEFYAYYVYAICKYFVLCSTYMACCS